MALPVNKRQPGTKTQSQNLLTFAAMNLGTKQVQEALLGRSPAGGREG